MLINCKGNLVDLSTAKVMGILNVTPDSFYDGGRRSGLQEYARHTAEMLEQGATFIDIGAYSSRPGATDISEEQELGRLLPVIEHLVKEFPEILLSVDTFRSKVARQAIACGAAIINDISAGFLDPEMMPTVAEMQVPFLMMHMRGNPKTMAGLNHYDNLLEEILYYFSERISKARSLGINDIIIDPGFGFSKNISQNFELLRKLELLHHLELPVLAGLSRKSMIYKILDTTPDQALNGTVVLNTIALTKGVQILRVHDVSPAMDAVKMYELLKKA